MSLDVSVSPKKRAGKRYNKNQISIKLTNFDIVFEIGIIPIIDMDQCVMSYDFNSRENIVIEEIQTIQ